MADDIVYVVDDDPPVRAALEMLIRSQQLAVESFPNAAAFLDSFKPGQPGCLVLDIRMPGMSGLDLQTELERRGSDLPIIFLTGHGDIQMAVQALKAGAQDFLEKPFRDQTLLDCIHRALEEGRESRDKRERAEDVQRRVASLTPRENEVLQRIIEGQPNKVVASELSLSERTIEIHRSRVMSKMGARSLAQLVRLMMQAQ